MISRLLGRIHRAERILPEPVPTDVVVVRGRWIPALAGVFGGMRGPAAAVTLGKAIIVHPDVPLSARLLRHELRHVQQWRSHGVAFPVLYAWRHLRHGYHDNPFEVEARAAEAQPPFSGGQA